MTDSNPFSRGLTRRSALQAAALSILGLTLHNTIGCSALRAQQRLVVGTRTQVIGDYEVQTWLSIIDLKTGEVSQVPVPLRGHSVVQHPTNPDLVVVLAQRTQRREGHALPLPGTDSCEVSLSEQRVTRVFRCDEGRHFYGHGAYTSDGAVLFTTENDFGGEGNGILTVRDAGTLQSLGRLPTHGIDPHEMRLIQGGRVAIVANGGEKTHPDYPYIVLNPDDHESTVVWIDMESGQLLDTVKLPGSRYGLRHFDADDDGTLIVAMQDGTTASEGDNMPVAIRYRGGELRLLRGPAGLAEQVGHHALSAALLAREGLAVATHPQGGRVTMWDVASGELVRTFEVAAPTGVAVSHDQRGFLVSSATGSLHLVEARADGAITELGPAEETIQWDSHLTNIVPARRG